MAKANTSSSKDDQKDQDQKTTSKQSNSKGENLESYLLDNGYEQNGKFFIKDQGSTVIRITIKEKMHVEKISSGQNDMVYQGDHLSKEEFEKLSV